MYPLIEFHQLKNNSVKQHRIVKKENNKDRSPVQQQSILTNCCLKLIILKSNRNKVAQLIITAIWYKKYCRRDILKKTLKSHSADMSSFPGNNI